MLSILLTAFGVSLAILITQFGNHIQERISKDGAGIDLVVGAKGSPLQLILSSVYHIDIPTGNIAYETTKIMNNNPQVKKAIPLALGDNWRGFRIVGTTNEYLDHYSAKFESGEVWKKEFEVVVGSNVELDIGQEIIGSHGLLEGGAIHQDEKYKVVGVLKKSNTVLDRLILTSINSVLLIHGHGEINHKDSHHLEHEEKLLDDELHHHDEVHHHNEKENHKKHIEKDSNHNHQENSANKNNNYSRNDELKDFKNKSDKEITALLIVTKSPTANMRLPRLINKESNLQAANPATEITRLTTMLGLGSKSFAILSIILIVIASLSIFSGLAATLENRTGDLAILRAVGYSKNRVFKIICFEGMSIVTLGILVGVLIGITIFSFFINSITPMSNTEAKISFSFEFIYIITGVFFSGLLASIFPAYNASKISVANQLSKNI